MRPDREEQNGDKRERELDGQFKASQFKASRIGVKLVCSVVPEISFDC